MSFALICFDWDGTLMDSQERIVNCLLGAFADVGCPAPSRAAAADVIGLGLDEAVGRLWPEADTAERRQVAAYYRSRFLGGDPTPTPLFPGALDTLNQLRGEGYLLAVATGKSRRGLDQSLAQTGLADYFQVTRCADETRSKPDPRMLQEIMETLDVKPGQTLMVGDTEYDMLMAANAGVAALAVAHGVHSPARLLACGPLACLHSLHDIPRWLQARAQPGMT
jgi:phosphoglycolate phosphatase